MTLDYHVISTLVEDKPGVLQKVAGMFNRRGFNIDSITVGKSEVEGQSRMVITVHADEKGLEQVTKQLNKLIDVIKIKDITKSAVKRELCLVKVAVPNAAVYKYFQSTYFRCFGTNIDGWAYWR